MIKNKSILSKGFTLIEMLTSVLISSSVFILLFFVFNQINMQMKLEENEFEINSYANLMLDKIALNLSKCSNLEHETRLGRTFIDLVISSDPDPTRMIVDLRKGLSINDVIQPGYLPDELLEDGTLSTKYNLHKFKIEDVGFSLGDIYSSYAQDARSASRNLYLEVLLFSKINPYIPYDTLKYNRRVFCPGLLIAESG